MSRRALALVVLILAALVSVSMIVAGVVRSTGGESLGDSFVLFGLLGLVVTASGGAVVAALPVVDAGRYGTLESAIRDVERAVRRVSEQSALSDDARRVINRRSERELLCRAIEEDIRTRDFEAASVLTEELAKRFGYPAEADRFRSEIERARSEGVDERVESAIHLVDRLIVERRWADASRECAALAEHHPHHPRVQVLAERVARAKQQYKEELERRFLLAAQGEQVDEAMELLRELDGYLTEQEAEPFREVARGVIGKARQNLGASFKLAYRDRQWGIAVGLGEQIIEQFPNSRMAAEVEQLMAELRDRAAAST
ncbi:MAG: hypothetical protein AAGB48_08850 [Planctomycetota bacterium]